MDSIVEKINQLQNDIRSEIKRIELHLETCKEKNLSYNQTQSIEDDLTWLNHCQTQLNNIFEFSFGPGTDEEGDL